MEKLTNMAQMQIPSDLKGKTALITGAGRGIGRAIAHALAEKKANIGIIARTQEHLNAVKDELSSYGIKCFAYSCDVKDEAALEHVVNMLENEFGAVDILINNAGIYKTETIEQITRASWQEVIDTNLTAPMLLSKLLLPGMIEKKWGRIVNISSVSGKMGEIYASAYSASKFALIGLTQSLALETANKGVTVNALCPGWVRTQMADDQFKDENWCNLNSFAADEAKTLSLLAVPQERFIEPQEIGHAVAFLCSDMAKGITGQAINICGGLCLT